jgi:hypothetical protein
VKCEKDGISYLKRDTLGDDKTILRTIHKAGSSGGQLSKWARV